ncbi:capsid triplex subunit 2 [Spheniscid alphaherpesvirus 1]|uniref:Capsid triplex subunit 2 n=1 Tax=Spheniscid alphaherpesvirus 1 TaxID=2560777 RepID=A0A1R3T5G4_9ALPH|nr:capsid triplex subunit 2 [Spheniscid alphaherpesvirus 1]SCO83574.1 capsid triplex subunit 2 [Spheniscid alphaherpesvirus 1]
MATESFMIEIQLPANISHADMAALQKCEGRVVFFSSLRRIAALCDIDYTSFFVNGAKPDALTLMAAYRRRFAAVLIRVLPGKITAAALGVSPIPAGLALQNTGPFELRNGDSVCFLPPVFGNTGSHVVRLESVGSELHFPVTVPSELSREVLAKLVAMSLEAIGANAHVQPRGPPRDSDSVYYNGKRYQITNALRQLDSVESTARTLILNMLFAINEGCSLLFALIPNLLTLGAQDGYVNALIQLESATRAVGQLIRQPQVPQAQDGERRFPVYEAVSSWIFMACRLGDDLGPRPLLRVCTFDGPSTIKPGEMAAVIPNWF